MSSTQSRKSRLLRSFSTIAQLFLLISPSLVNSQSWVIEESQSLGLKKPISQDQRTTENFQIYGAPQIYSDRMLLTIPGIGNQRTGVWSQFTNMRNEWSVKIDLRASGGEKAGGSFTYWYTQQGPNGQRETDTIYSAKPWDGLAVVLDQQGGNAGSIRAYLNDGTIDYSIHHDPASLAFGHCDYVYRNKGVLSSIVITQTSQEFKIEADGHLCFSTLDVRLPTTYYMGMSAVTSDPPDSFELFQFVVSRPEVAGQPPPPSQPQVGKPQARGGQAQADLNADSQGRLPHEQDFDQWVIEEGEEDHEAEWFKNQDQQFKDLHDRLQALTHHLASIQAQIGMVYDKVDSLHHKEEELRAEMRGTRVPREQIDKMDGKIQIIENLAMQIGNAITAKDYSGHFEALQKTLKEHHSNLLYAVPDTVTQVLQTGAPRLGTAVGILIVFQVILAGGYIYYKRRRSQSPKKYL